MFDGDTKSESTRADIGNFEEGNAATAKGMAVYSHVHDQEMHEDRQLIDCRSNMFTKGSKENDKKCCENGPSITTLDVAMDLTGIGAYNVLHMLICGVILMGVIMQSLVLGYVMPAAQCDLDLTLQQRGWLAAMPFVAIILTSHMWGWLADTRGRKPVMQYSMLLSVVISVASSFSPNLVVLAVSQFLSSIFMAGSSAVVYTFLGEFNNLRHRDKMVSFGASFVGIGTVLLPGVSWLILPLEFSYAIDFLGIVYRPWRLLVVAATIPFMIGAILLTFISDSPKFLNGMGRLDECLDVVKSIYSVNKRMPKDSFPVKALVSENQVTNENAKTGLRSILVSMRDQTVPLFKTPLLKWTLLTCFVQFGIFAAVNGFYVWFPTILNALADHDSGNSTICQILDMATAPAVNGTQVECDDTINTSTFERSIYLGLIFCSMYIVVGVLVDSLGKKLILVVVLGGSGICGMIAHTVPDNIGSILFAIFQMSGACIGLMSAASVELYPTKYRAMALCLAMMMGRVGSVLGSNLIGFFLQVNCGASFYLFGGILLVCSLLCLTLPAKKKAPSKTLTQEPAQNETHEPV